MQQVIFRGRQVVIGVESRHAVRVVEQGGVLVRNGRVERVAPFDELCAAEPQAQVIGDGRDIILPGFVNAHHHVGLTPIQLGSPDMPLELWFVTRLICRSVDFYLDTLYSAFEMIASGVTTVQHLHGWLPGGPEGAESGAAEVLQAYDDIGMRASYSVATRDQSRLVYGDDEAFLATLPKDLRTPLARHFARFGLTLDQQMDLFETLRARVANNPRLAVQLAPANLHWCSDAALARVAEMSERYEVPMHMHLLETAYQKEYAARRGIGSAVEQIDRFGLLNSRMTLGHGVWMSEADIERVAESGACICHNCSSNFRLRSGVAPLNEWERHGVTTALGIDEAGLNDDRDMLTEMRMALRAHRVPGHDPEAVPSIPQILRMATSGGAATTPFSAEIGVLEPGRAADLVMIDADRVSQPFLDPEMPLLDATVIRAKSDWVRRTVVGGETIYADGHFMRVDRGAAMEALSADLQRALRNDEIERRGLAKALLPHVEAFYKDWINTEAAEPFYKQSARH